MSARGWSSATRTVTTTETLGSALASYSMLGNVKCEMSGVVPMIGLIMGSLGHVLGDQLLCLLREKNILSRADLDELCRKVDNRAAGQAEGPLPCCAENSNGVKPPSERAWTSAPCCSSRRTTSRWFSATAHISAV